jgi:hypothetical protein
VFWCFLWCLGEFDVCCKGVIRCACRSAAKFVTAKHASMMLQHHIAQQISACWANAVHCKAHVHKKSCVVPCRAVMPWLTIPTITGKKFPNLALLWPHKQGTKTFVLLQMDCLKIIFLATVCISVENVHTENWHLLWNALRSISNPKNTKLGNIGERVDPYSSKRGCRMTSV